MSGDLVIPNQGLLRIDVWPTYLGMAESRDDGATFIEPLDGDGYQRGMITWETQPDGNIIGHARLCLPRGVHTHLLFCHGPGAGMIIGIEQLEHPLVFDRAGYFDVNPIHHKSYLPR